MYNQTNKHNNSTWTKMYLVIKLWFLWTKPFIEYLTAVLTLIKTWSPWQHHGARMSKLDVALRLLHKSDFPQVPQKQPPCVVKTSPSVTQLSKSPQLLSSISTDKQSLSVPRPHLQYWIKSSNIYVCKCGFPTLSTYSIYSKPSSAGIAVIQCSWISLSGSCNIHFLHTLIALTSTWLSVQKHFSLLLNLAITSLYCINLFY